MTCLYIYQIFPIVYANHDGAGIVPNNFSSFPDFLGILEGL